jgi:hypothetical protein
VYSIETFPQRQLPDAMMNIDMGDCFFAINVVIRCSFCSSVAALSVFISNR